jgi:hypothetical protein
MSTSYHQQFRENQRNKNQNDLFSNSKATAGGKLPAQRPTAVVKQSFRSDTFTLPTKRDETNFKVPKVNQAQNGSRRQAAKKPDVVNSSPPAERKDIMRTNGGIRPTLKQVNSTMDRQNLQRKPVRFANDYNNTYYSSSPASLPVYHQRTAPLADPLPREAIDKSRRMRVANDEYIMHRRRDSPAYAYNDYRTVSDIPTTSYRTSLPPITQTRYPTAPTVVIRPQEIPRSAPPPAPIFILPSPAPPTSTMVLPPPTVPSYSNPTSTMIFSTIPPQQPQSTFFLPPPQPFLLPFPYSNPNPPVPAPPPPPPPPQPQTVINQTTSSSASASAAAKSENKTEESHATIIVHPNTIQNNKKNVTIQLKMIDEVCFLFSFFIFLKKILVKLLIFLFPLNLFHSQLI